MVRHVVQCGPRKEFFKTKKSRTVLSAEDKMRIVRMVGFRPARPCSRPSTSSMYGAASMRQKLQSFCISQPFVLLQIHKCTHYE